MYDAVHLGIAVDLDFEGLVVPVVRDADDLRLAALAAALKDERGGGPGAPTGRRRLRRRDVHHHQRRALRHPADGPDHQPAPGGHPVHRRREDPAGRRPAGRRRPRPGRPPGGQPRPLASTTGRSTGPMHRRSPRRSGTPWNDVTGRTKPDDRPRRAGDPPSPGPRGPTRRPDVHPGRVHGRGRRRLPPGLRVPGHRRPGDQPPEAEPGLLPDLRRRPRGAAASAWPVTSDPATTGSSPTTATRRSSSASASRPTRSCCRPSARPTTRRRAAARCRAHWGHARAQHRHPVAARPAASACPRSGCAEAARYIVRRPQPPRLRRPTATSSPTCRSARGACSEGEFWESLNTACTPPPAGALRRRRQRLRHLGAARPTRRPAPVSELVRGFRGLDIHRLDGTDYFEVRERAPRRSSATSGPASAPRSSTPTSTRPYSHSRADTQTSTGRRTSWPTRRPTTRSPAGARRSSRPACSTADEAAEHPGRGASAHRGRGGQARRSPRAGPTRPRSPTTSSALPASADAGAPTRERRRARCRSARRSSARCTSRWRPTSASGSSARTSPTPGKRSSPSVEGKGGVFGTTHGLQRAFGQARCYNTPLAEANIIGRAVGQAHPGPAPGARDPVLRLHLAGHDQQLKSEAATIRWRSNGAFTCPMVVRVPIGGYLTGGAIWHSQCGESIFAHVPGLLIAFPSRAARRRRACCAPRFRCEDPVLFLEHKHLLRQPYTATRSRRPDYARPVRSGRRSAGPGDDLHGRHLGRDRARSPSQAAERHRRLTAGSRSRSSTCARSSRGTRSWWPSPSPGRAGCWSCTRTC